MMKRILGLCPLVGVLMLSAGSAGANEMRVVASATGGYQATYGGRTRSIEFVALRDAGNNVKGQAQFKNLDSGVILHYDVTCLRVEGNVATMSGVAKTVSDLTAEFPYFWLQVADNGQGRQATDFVSPFVSFPADVGCFEDVFPTVFPAEVGNIQIKGE